MSDSDISKEAALSIIESAKAQQAEAAARAEEIRANSQYAEKSIEAQKAIYFDSNEKLLADKKNKRLHLSFGALLAFTLIAILVAIGEKDIALNIAVFFGGMGAGYGASKIETK